MPPQIVIRAISLGWCMWLAGCGAGEDGKPREVALLAEGLEAKWVAAGIPEQGPVTVSEGVLRVGEGLPMSGARFEGDWEALGLPWTQYELTFEARRVEGQDFFATCTFPAGGHDRCVSLVLGGWGGGLVGISSIDHLDASENSTRGEMRFENGEWYRVRIEVREDDLRVWINDAPMVNTSIKSRHLGLRPGDIDRCVPLGFATWRTIGEIRAVRVSRLKK
jgi:hypothetical protein